MTVLSDYVERMVDGGMEANEAMQIVAEIYAAGVANASARTANAKRQQRFRDRNKALRSVTNRNENIGPKTVTNRNEVTLSNASANVPLSKNNIKKESKRQNRGTRIAPDWTPSDAERSFAKQQGFSEFEINREIDKFRDYWISCAGAKGVKLDWSATWRQWTRNGAERAGKAPLSAPGAVVVGLFYAKTGSEQLAAWDAYGLRTTGKGMPRDKNQGWHCKSEWPPDYVRLEPPEGHLSITRELKGLHQ